jgi:CRP/FNR family cyclic AMP-dependent transcriptional regulator
VKVLVNSTDGYRAVLALRNTGDLLGEQAGVDGQPRSATLYALTEVEGLIIPLNRYRVFAQTHPGVTIALQHVLSERLREADYQRAEAGAKPVQTRLATLLLDLCERYGTPTQEGYVRIALPLSQDDLAGLVLTSRRTISRILEHWRVLGWILTGRRRIGVKRIDALRKEASGARGPDNGQ